MPAPIYRRLALWIFNHLLWDSASPSHGRLWPALWATRKLLAAVALSSLLTWRELVEHHPPDVAFIVIMHFVFVLAVIALFVYIGQWFSHRTSPTGK